MLRQVHLPACLDSDGDSSLDPDEPRTARRTKKEYARTNAP